MKDIESHPNTKRLPTNVKLALTIEEEVRLELWRFCYKKWNWEGFG